LSRMLAHDGSRESRTRNLRAGSGRARARPRSARSR
jgi:hypothetical protein